MSNAIHDWGAVARALGLTLQTSGTYSESFSFPGLKRAMARGDGTSSNPWMFGTWPVSAEPGARRVEVMVLVDVRAHLDWLYAETHAIARIAAPLLYGLDLHTWRWFEGAFTPQWGIGHGPFDHAFRFDALDHHRARQLFGPAIIERLLPYSDATIHITDSVVDIRCAEGVERDAPSLARRLDNAVTLAEALAARRREIPASNAERETFDGWAEVAAAEGLVLDRAAARMEGDVEGLATTLAVEGTPGKLRTVLHVRLPRSLGLGLRMFEQLGVSFLAELFGRQDIVIGDPAFDSAFVIQGNEPGVRAVLANPHLRRALHQLLVGSDGFEVDDRGLFVRWPYVFQARDPLRSAIAHVRMVRDGLGIAGPAAPAGAPYR
jgi:hypothetical protein